MSMQSEAIVTNTKLPATVGPASATGTPAANQSIRVSGKTAVLLAPAVTVIATMLVGCVVLTVAGAPLHALEMNIGGLINLSGGIAAALVIIMMMQKGVVGVAQAGI